MTENKKLTRVRRIDTKLSAYVVGEAVPRKGGDIIRAIHQIGETTFRVDLDPYTTLVSEMQVEKQVERFIVVFNAVSADIEALDPPIIEKATGLEVVK